jgi:hypothetical protein
LTVGNMALGYLAPYAPAMLQSGYMGVATKAAVRSGVAWALDRYLIGMVTRDHTAFRVGAAIAIVGSALLEFLGKSLVLGQGDTAQSIQQFVPTALGAYLPGRNLRGLDAYTRSLRGVGMGSLNYGGPTQMGNQAHQRLYGYGA